MSGLRWYRFAIYEGKPVTAALSLRGLDARSAWTDMAADLGCLRVARLEQVHGNRVIKAEGETVPPLPEADALVTDTRNLALFVRVADCAPVYLFDPANRATGLAHAGWRGLCRGVITNTVREMNREFGTRPEDLLTAVGPSLGPCCARFSDPAHEIPSIYHEFITEDRLVNLWAIARHQLLAAGIAEKNIEQAEHCTRCDGTNFSSHRRGDSERMGAFLVLR